MRALRIYLSKVASTKDRDTNKIIHLQLVSAPETETGDKQSGCMNWEVKTYVMKEDGYGRKTGHGRVTVRDRETVFALLNRGSWQLTNIGAGFTTALPRQSSAWFSFYINVKEDEIWKTNSHIYNPQQVQDTYNRYTEVYHGCRAFWLGQEKTRGFGRSLLAEVQFDNRRVSKSRKHSSQSHKLSMQYNSRMLFNIND